MEYNLNPISLNALLSLHEVAASGRADTAALIAKFRAQRQRSQRLQEYRDQIFAEIRVSQSNPGTALMPSDKRAS